MSMELDRALKYVITDTLSATREQTRSCQNASIVQAGKVRFPQIPSGRGAALSKMLSSWKEIAHFFGKGVRTVQRWEKTLDLPIHRPPGAPSNVVLARTSDLEEWMHRGQSAGALASNDDEASPSPVMFDALASLEREVALLAQKTGIPSGEVHMVTTPEQRLTSLTGMLRQVNERLSSSRSARAA